MTQKTPYFFPIRHLSPGGAWHLVQFLEEIEPDIVLVEGPSDLEEELNDIVQPTVKPPIAILAYTEEMPVQTILYPLAEYSPEYQAIKWAKANDRQVRFIDLPTDVMLAVTLLENQRIKEAQKLNNLERDIYEEIYEAEDDLDYETFWERNFEHNLKKDTYRLGMLKMGEGLREFTEKADREGARHVIREAFMKAKIQEALKEGYKPEKIVVVTGAYHTGNLQNENCRPLTRQEIKGLPSVKSKVTLMPYSYYRLSSRSGYGAGNQSPYYYEMMWHLMNKDHLEEMPVYYMTAVVKEMRKEGYLTSSAEVIEAVRLAQGLAKLHDGTLPTLQDLRDGAKTCLGQGEFGKIAEAVASVEIGTKIGKLPDGMSKTALQNNFNYMLHDLKLERYKSVVAQDLVLDLRENRRVKSEKAAFLDLNRSYFLYQLNVTGISFAKIQNAPQGSSANWKEIWVLAWQPETEIELVESALYGDTIRMAAAYVMKEGLDKADCISKATRIIEDAYKCGISEMVDYALQVIQKLGVDTNSFEELAAAAMHLSLIVRFGSVRRIDTEKVKPLLAELFFRAALLMGSAANCNADAAKTIGEALSSLDNIASYHDDLVDVATYIKELTKLSDRDDCNPELAGMACSILVERHLLDPNKLEQEMSRRLMPGIPADIGAGWFEGLASRNRYVMLAYNKIWEKLDQYIMALDTEELKSAVVFLHRTFSTFSENDKHMIAENLANIWGLDQDAVSNVLNGELTEDEEKMVEDLQDFDFDF